MERDIVKVIKRLLGVETPEDLDKLLENIPEYYNPSQQPFVLSPSEVEYIKKLSKLKTKEE